MRPMKRHDLQMVVAGRVVSAADVYSLEKVEVAKETTEKKTCAMKRQELHFAWID
jgi:hypothetical protein